METKSVLEMTDDEIDKLSSKELETLINAITEEEAANADPDKLNELMGKSFVKFIADYDNDDDEDETSMPDDFREKYLKAFNSLSDPCKAVKDGDNHRFRSLPELLGDMFCNVTAKMIEQEAELSSK